MWIVNKYGVAVNTDHVARFSEDVDGDVVAETPGLPPALARTVIGHVDLSAIMANIASNTKIMEVR